MSVDPLGSHRPAWTLQHPHIPMSDAYVDEALDDLADYLQFAAAVDGVDLRAEEVGIEGWRLIGESRSTAERVGLTSRTIATT